MNRNKIFLLLFVVIFFVVISFFWVKRSYFQYLIFGVYYETVRGKSMEPYLLDGDEVKIDSDYYEKNQIQKGDVVIIDFEWRQDPVVKFVHAIPGDEFGIERQQDGSYFVLVNGEAIKNSENEFYSLSYSKTRMLDLYINDFDGVIPENMYLVFGNLTQGTQDSTQFGLIQKEKIIGKVVGVVKK